MENSLLATESFSYCWVLSRRISLDGLEEPLRLSFYSSNESTPTKMMYEIVKSRRFLEEDLNFNFDTLISKSPAPLVHADEIFSDGHIKPLYAADQLKLQVFDASNLAPATPLYSLSHRPTRQIDRIHRFFLGKWRKSSKNILLKCFGFIRPLCRRVGCSRKSIRVDDIDRKVLEVQSLSNSLQASPQRNTAGHWFGIKQISTQGDNRQGHRKAKSWDNFSRATPPRGPAYAANVSCDIESSVYEAVLHCKRSIAN